jgi:hypothetical protein
MSNIDVNYQPKIDPNSYHPVVLSCNGKRAEFVFGPERIIINSQFYEIVRSIFDKHKLAYLIGKDKRVHEEEEGRFYLFDISKEPKAVHDRLSNIEITTPEKNPRKLDVFDLQIPQIETENKSPITEDVKNMWKYFGRKRKNVGLLPPKYRHK